MTDSTAQRPTLRICLLGGCLLFACAQAGVALAAEGDPLAGKRRTVTCNACHGQAAMKNVPSLGGQNPAYFVAAMVAFQDGVRPHATMRDVAKSRSLQELKNFAAWYGESPAAVAEVQEGAPPPSSAERCAACHGTDGRTSIAAEVPRIAGQKAGYLGQVLREYRTGARTHAVMQAQAADLGDDDIAALARHFAERPGLQVK